MRSGSPNVVEALDIWFKIAPLVGIAFWIGLFWRRATPAGAWAGTLAAVAAWRVLTLPAVAEGLASVSFVRQVGAVTAGVVGQASIA